MLKVPCSPLNDLKQVFADLHIQYRGMQMGLNYPAAAEGWISLIGNPVQMSASPPQYRMAPPTLGEPADEILVEVLDLDQDEISELKRNGTV